jgi:hypothetical protein
MDGAPAAGVGDTDRFAKLTRLQCHTTGFDQDRSGLDLDRDRGAFAD